MQKLKYILNAYLALFIYIFSRRKKDIWLIGGHNGMLYTDNAKVLYEYILERDRDIEIYWIVDRKSPLIDEIKGEKIIKGSIKNYLYFYHSRANLFSDTFNSDIAPFAYILPCVRFIYFRRFKVFLNHGRVAFKRVPKFPYPIQKIKDSIYRSYNLAVASTELEKIAMVDYGLEDRDIVILGSARDDMLFNIELERGDILIAPSWRGWLFHNDTLVGSKFYKNYTDLLSNKRLNSYLKRNNIYINFYLHHMFHKFYKELSEYKSDMITILEPKADISRYIRGSKMLITDYSSLSADFYYLKKPVIFFQFDRERYIREIGSYIDLERDSFGDVAFSVDEVVDRVIDTIEGNYRVSSLQREGEKLFINFIDRDNCKRVYNKIREKI